MLKSKLADLLPTVEHFAQVPNRGLAAHLDGRIGAKPLAFYNWLSRVANKRGVSWYSERRKAEIFGRSKRTIQRWQEALTTEGLIELQPRGGDQTDYTIVRHHPGRCARHRQVVLPLPEVVTNQNELFEGPGSVDTSSSECTHPENHCAPVQASKSGAHGSILKGAPFVNPSVESNTDLRVGADGPQGEQDEQGERREQDRARFRVLAALAAAAGLPGFAALEDRVLMPGPYRRLLRLNEEALKHGFEVLGRKYDRITDARKLLEILLDRAGTYRVFRGRRRGAQNRRFDNIPRHSDPEPPLPERKPDPDPEVVTLTRSERLDTVRERLRLKMRLPRTAVNRDVAFKRWLRGADWGLENGRPVLVFDTFFDTVFVTEHFGPLIRTEFEGAGFREAPPRFVYGAALFSEGGIGEQPPPEEDGAPEAEKGVLLEASGLGPLLPF